MKKGVKVDKDKKGCVGMLNQGLRLIVAFFGAHKKAERG
jgi:hypothetical protein